MVGDTEVEVKWLRAQPEQLNQHEAELKKYGKSYEFHHYDGAGHGFF